MALAHISVSCCLRPKSEITGGCFQQGASAEARCITIRSGGSARADFDSCTNVVKAAANTAETGSSDPGPPSGVGRAVSIATFVPRYKERPAPVFTHYDSARHRSPQ